MGKSLPSLSDFFNSKKANNASENILLGAGRTITSKKSSEDTEENNIANGSNTNAQKVSMLPPISLQVTIFRFFKPKNKKKTVSLAYGSLHIFQKIKYFRKRRKTIKSKLLPSLLSMVPYL